MGGERGQESREKGGREYRREEGRGIVAFVVSYIQYSTRYGNGSGKGGGVGVGWGGGGGNRTKQGEKCTLQPYGTQTTVISYLYSRLYSTNTWYRFNV